jgi:hypothetical protein
MNFKLNFHISGESKLSNADIFDRIAAVLKYKKYRVLSTTFDTITFDCNPWRLKLNTAPIQVDGGTFEIHPSSGGQSVSLKYYFNFLYPAIFIIIFFTMLISDKHYDGLWFFAVFFPVTIIITILRVRSKGKTLLRDVLCNT